MNQTIPMPYCRVCLVTVKLSVSALVNLDVKTIGIGLSVKSTIGLALEVTSIYSLQPFPPSNTQITQASII